MTLSVNSVNIVLKSMKMENVLQLILKIVYKLISMEIVNFVIINI